MTLLLLLEILYILIILAVMVKIILDTEDYVKATAYALLVALLPIIGILVYFAVGLNYRKKAIYSKKLILDENQGIKIHEAISAYREKGGKDLKEAFPRFYELNHLFPHKLLNFATGNNKVDLLQNGESKFPELLKSIADARDYIHLEYYIYENDDTGLTLARALLKKAAEGVKVRFIYDDFGSRSIRKKIVPHLKKNGIEAFPFYKIAFINFANRLNYRNHRKIVIIDGKIAFVGGINVSDKYDNRKPRKLYWRDTHLKIEGEAVWSLQDIFLADWNFCSGQGLKPNLDFFRRPKAIADQRWVQIIASGPDSRNPNILYSYIQLLQNAKESVYITTPYFIPTKELLSALKITALRGVKTILLVPGVSDSFLVNTVSQSHYQTLLESGVQIFLYRKGFVHAKTMVCDDQVSVVGTANLDHRSFELNFEVNAVVYSPQLAKELRQGFLNDLEHSEEIHLKEWLERPFHKHFIEKAFRLVGPLL